MQLLNRPHPRGCPSAPFRTAPSPPLQAIAIAVHYANEWPLLVVCPTSMSLTWCEELERWCPFLAPGDINLVRSHHNA